MTFPDFLPFLEAFGLIAVVLMAAVLYVWYSVRRSQDRLASLLAEYTAAGLMPQTRYGLLGAVLSSITGEHRGRNLAISHASPTSPRHPDYGQQFTAVRTAVRCPPGAHLAITPKWPHAEFFAKWLSPKTHEVKDHFFVQSDPPNLAERLLALPRTSAILFSDPKPTIEVRTTELRFLRPIDLPNPQDALALLDVVCDLAQILEEVSNSDGAA